MGLHKEGYPTLIISFIILALIVFGVNEIFINYPIVGQLLSAAAFLFWLAIVSFFRYPKFNVEKNQNHIISPADGKVVVIEKVRFNEFLDEERIQVSIFMSPTDTHMNRYPIDGEVLYSKHHPGKHHVAWLPKSSTDNEQTTVIIENSRLSIAMRQIAGAVARRIVCYAKVGKEVIQGEQLGFIKFGSRVDVFLPLDAKINVTLEQSVKAGKTVLAEMK